MSVAEPIAPPSEREARGSYVHEDRDALTFHVERRALRDQDVFMLERERVWFHSWLYLGHETEVPELGDFKVRSLGGRELIFCRSQAGDIEVYLNSCPHRGTTLCREEQGNSRFFKCFYHAWSFSNEGALVALPGEDAYPEDGAFRDRLALKRVPLVDSYEGFVFVSFNADAGPLLDHLGPAADYMKLVTDQSEHGLEVIPGTQKYTVWSNWKIGVENAVDGYHFLPTHTTFVDYLKDTGFKVTDEGGLAEPLGNGHCIFIISGHSGRVALNWEPRFGEEHRATVEANSRAVRERLGERADRLIGSSRILFVFPNLLLFDIESLMIRRLEPTAADRTDVEAWELCPRGEDEATRGLRTRMLATFMGPGGLATPDDIEAAEAVQRGIQNTENDPRPGADWNDISRGMAAELEGRPGRGVDEAAIRGFWRHWNSIMTDEES